MEMYQGIRFFGLLIISLYVYKKILNINDVPKLKIASAIIFSLILSIVLSYVPPLYEVIFVVSVFIFVSITARVNIYLMITAVIISVGISVGIDILTGLVLSLLHDLFESACTIVNAMCENIPLENINIYISIPMPSALCWQTVESLISAAIVYFFFKMKRLKKGFIFLQSKEGRWLGIIFCMLIMISGSFMEFIEKIVEAYSLSNADSAAIFVFFYFALGVYMLGIHFWWRNHTIVLYQQLLTERMSQEHHAEMEEKDSQMKSLSDCNDFLSKAVHRDNKLVPAMYNAVASFLSVDHDNETKLNGMNILNELDEIIQERKEMIVQFQKEHKPLPSTEIERVDTILNYMRLRALEKGIQFDFVMAERIKDIGDSTISHQKLETLLADLIENAIIAVSYSPDAWAGSSHSKRPAACKKIRVHMGMADDCFEIAVQDSGIPFEVETLVDLGLKKSTTHADEGGSGIGYVTIFEILHECSASLIISEQEPEDYTFSKSIKVRFDGKSEFVIHSFRAEKIILSKEREDMGGRSSNSTHL